MTRTARVFLFRRTLAQAACECGWWGARRRLRALAVHDALMHCAEFACQPAKSLVVDFRSALAVTVGGRPTLHLRRVSLIEGMSYDRHRGSD